MNLKEKYLQLTKNANIMIISCKICKSLAFNANVSHAREERKGEELCPSAVWDPKEWLQLWLCRSQKSDAPKIGEWNQWIPPAFLSPWCIVCARTVVEVQWLVWCPWRHSQWDARITRVVGARQTQRRRRGLDPAQCLVNIVHSHQTHHIYLYLYNSHLIINLHHYKTWIKGVILASFLLNLLPLTFIWL